MEAFKWEQKRVANAKKERERDKETHRKRESSEKRMRDKETKDKDNETVQKEVSYQESELSSLEQMIHLEAIKAHTSLETTSLSSRSVILDVGLSETPGSNDHSDPLALATTSNAEARASITKPDATDTPSMIETSGNDTAFNTFLNTTSDGELNPTAEYASVTSPHHRSPTPRSDSSESIYAFIIRRIATLEGNSTLVARYIEEQSRTMRLLLSRTEQSWDKWKLEYGAEEQRRREQEVSQ